MSKVIKEYYEKAGVQPLLIEEKLKKLTDNNDILREFEYWILNRIYIDEVRVDGYSASDLAMQSVLLEGEGSFMLLIELRENPNKAKKRIKSGFKIK